MPDTEDDMGQYLDATDILRVDVTPNADGVCVVSIVLGPDAATVIESHAARHGGDKARAAHRLLGARELWRRVRFFRASRQRLADLAGA